MVKGEARCLRIDDDNITVEISVIRLTGYSR